MRGFLLRVYTLPWPRSLRSVIENVAGLPILRLLLVPHFMVGVVGVIRNELGEFLLFKHTYRPATPWGLPTGFLEHGERPDDALRREIREEAGVDVQLTGLWTVQTADRRDLLSLVYRGTGSDGFRPSNEISQAGYFAPERLPPLLPDQRALIEACVREDRH